MGVDNVLPSLCRLGRGAMGISEQHRLVQTGFDWAAFFVQFFVQREVWFLFSLGVQLILELLGIQLE